MPTIAYVYGRPGCGKTQMIRDIFARQRRSTQYLVLYDFQRADVMLLARHFAMLGHAADKTFVVVCTSLQPDAVPDLPKKYVYCVDAPDQLNAARKFFEYVTSS